MIPCADDDMVASDWIDCADAFLLGRIGGHLADARGSATPRLSPWPGMPAVRSTPSPAAVPSEVAGAGNGAGRGTCRPVSRQPCWLPLRPAAAGLRRAAARSG